MRILRIVFLALTAAGVALALYRLWPDVSHALASMSVGSLALSVLLALGYQLTGLLAWRRTLKELGSPTSVGSAAHIYLVSQVGKYIPGSVWAGLAMVRLGQEANIPRARMAYSYALSLAFSMMTGLAIGVPALIAYGNYLPLAIASLAVLAVVLLWPRLLNGILDRGLRLARRGSLEQPLSGKGISQIVGLYVIAWVFAGLSIWALTTAIASSTAQAPFLSTAAFAVASTLGVLVVLAPAGAGVRDVVMVLILSPLVGVPGATAVSVLSRATLTVLDVAGAAIAGVGRRWTRPRESRVELHDAPVTDTGRP